MRASIRVASGFFVSRNLPVVTAGIAANAIIDGALGSVYCSRAGDKPPFEG